MFTFATSFLFLLIASAQGQGATLVKSYNGTTFFDDWTFQDSADTTTHGQVQYLPQSTASSDGLAYINSQGQAIIAADDTTTLGAGALRNSVRITSNDNWGVGTLVIADFTHLPYGCTTWPAFWLVGPNWPYDGEIDIFEGVNDNTMNQMTLHTGPGCSHDPSTAETGAALDASCDSTGTNNDGCGVTDSSTQSYGADFASAGGGVFAMALTDDGVSIWRWNRASIPSEITSGGNPDATSWGTPVATWAASTCTPSSNFQSLNLVFDITACGDWAGQASVWSASSCSAAYSTCSAAVADPTNFQNAFFEVNYVNVYSM